MSKTTEIAVWIPLRPGASWRGEGIAQTIEQILENLPEDLICNLVVSKAHEIDLIEISEKNNNIKIKSIGFIKGKKETYSSEKPVSVGFLGLLIQRVFSSRIKSFNFLIQNIRYATALYFYTALQRLGLFLPKSDVLWFPSPIIPGTKFLKGKKIYSFWDPFVFEYREFGDIAATLIKQFISLYKNADVITTQSQANKNFLSNILNINSEKIEIINNGSPDYSSQLPALQKLEKSDKDGIIKYWPSKTYVAGTQKAATDKMIADKINQTIFWRLLYKTSELANSRILMISTQMRPYKGFGVLFELLNKLVLNETKYSFHFIFTAEIPPKTKQDFPLLYERIHEITRVSTKQHALLYYISDLVLHPSYVEGGLGVYPQFEAASVGTPCLVNIGRHVLEQRSDRSLIAKTTSDFVDLNGTVKRIEDLMQLKEERILNIKESESLRVSWKASSEKYADIFKKVVNV